MPSSRTDGIRGTQWLAQERIGVGVTPSGSVFEEYKTVCEYVRRLMKPLANRRLAMTKP